MGQALIHDPSIDGNDWDPLMKASQSGLRIIAYFASLLAAMVYWINDLLLKLAPHSTHAHRIVYVAIISILGCGSWARP